MVSKWSGVLSTTEPRNDIGILNVRQGNKNSEIAEFQIIENNKPYDLTGLTVLFCASFGLNQVEKTASVVNAKEGKISYTFDDDAMQQVGRNKGYFSIKKAEAMIDSTQEFEYRIQSSIYSRLIDAKSYILRLDVLIKLIEDFIYESKNNVSASIKSFESFITNEKANVNTWVDSMKEIIYGIDPGGSVLRELIEARKDTLNKIFPSLKARLDTFETDTTAQFQQTENKLAQKASINYVDAILMDIAKGGPNNGPNDLFYSIESLNQKYPNGPDKKGTWLVLDSSFTDGAHSFMWDSTNSIWKDLGVYQSRVLADGEVSKRKLDNELKGSFIKTKWLDSLFEKDHENLFDQTYSLRGVLFGNTLEYFELTTNPTFPNAKVHVLKIQKDTYYTISTKNTTRNRYAVSNKIPSIGSTNGKYLFNDDGNGKSFSFNSGNNEYLMLYLSENGSDVDCEVTESQYYIPTKISKLSDKVGLKEGVVTEKNAVFLIPEEKGFDEHINHSLEKLYINSIYNPDNELIYYLTASPVGKSVVMKKLYATETIKLSVKNHNRFRLGFFSEDYENLKIEKNPTENVEYQNIIPKKVIYLDSPLESEYVVNVPDWCQTIVWQISTNQNQIPDYKINSDFVLSDRVKVKNENIIGLDSLSTSKKYVTIGNADYYSSPLPQSTVNISTKSGEVFALYNSLLSDSKYMYDRKIVGKDSGGNDLYSYTIANPLPTIVDYIDEAYAPAEWQKNYKPVVFLVGGSHGDEKGSVWGLAQFIKHLCEDNTAQMKFIRNNCVVKVIPILNIAGFNNNTRNNANNVNLNRDFGIMSQIESRIVRDWVENEKEAIALFDCHNTVGKPSFWSMPNDEVTKNMFLVMSQELESGWIAEDSSLDSNRPLTEFVNLTSSGTMAGYGFSKGLISTTIEATRHADGMKGTNNFAFDVLGTKTGTDLIANAVILSLKYM